MKYRIQINDRKYQSWTVFDENNQPVNIPNFCPIELKLFSGDNFLYDPSSLESSFSLLFSNIRNKTQYAGVLQLDKMIKKIKDKTYYKCIPDDIRLPFFLVPYQQKIGFSKKYTDKYVLFEFDHWLYDHPYAKLTNVLGPVDDLPVFYEYQLYCKSLHISLKEFTDQTKKKIETQDNPQIENLIRQIEENPQYQIESRKMSHSVFSIDPLGSLDFDDAFSVQCLSPDSFEISIYIANVFVWLENLNLWDSFSNRVSTIYLPDRKRPMLPTILSDHLCSLQNGVTRFAFTMDITILCDENGIPHIQGQPRFSNTSIDLYKNYVYDEPTLLCDPNYRKLFEITTKMKKGIEDSHDLVAHWMVYMNQICGEYMANRGIGIFRSVVHKPPEFIQSMEHINTRSLRIVEQWGNTSGQYVKYSEDMTGHQIMNIASYIHITSPIRRLVDLLNQIEILRDCNIVTSFSSHSILFFDKWTNPCQIDYINQSMRLIRRVQEDCEILCKCTAQPELLEREHRGILFDKTKKNDGFYNYMVYLEDIGILSKIVTYEELEEYSYMTFRLFLFKGEDKIKRKIRVSICHQC